MAIWTVRRFTLWNQPAILRLCRRKHIIPMYEEYVEPTKEFVDLVVDGERSLEESLGAVLARVYPQA